MNLIQLCTQSTHPLVHKALGNADIFQRSLNGEWWIGDADRSIDYAQPYHEAAVAWESAKILWTSPSDKVNAASVIGMALYEREGWEAALVAALEALEVE